MTTWQQGAKKHETYRWFAVPLPAGTYCLGRLLAHRGKSGVAYFFPPELDQLPPADTVGGLGTRDAFTMEKFSLLGVENDRWPVVVGFDLAGERWPLVEIERRPSIPGQPFRRVASRLVDDRHHLASRPTGIVPEEQYDLRPEDGSHGAQSLPVHLQAYLRRLARDGFETGQFWDPLERIGATYYLERVDAPSRPSRLVLVRIPGTPGDPIRPASQAAAEDWCDRLEATVSKDPGVEVDGWEVGDDGIGVFIYGTDPKEVLRRIAAARLPFPAGSSAVVEPHTEATEEVALA